MCADDGPTTVEVADAIVVGPSCCAAGVAGGGRWKLGTVAVTAGMPSYHLLRESTRVWWSKRCRRFLSNDATLAPVSAIGGKPEKGARANRRRTRVGRWSVDRGLQLIRRLREVECGGESNRRKGRKTVKTARRAAAEVLHLRYAAISTRSRESAADDSPTTAATAPPAKSGRCPWQMRLYVQDSCRIRRTNMWRTLLQNAADESTVDKSSREGRKTKADISQKMVVTPALSPDQ